MIEDPDASPEPRAPDDAAWELNRAEPSSWVAFWPDAECPERSRVMQALAGWAGTDIEVGDATTREPMPDIAWSCAANLPGVESKLVIWAERASPFPPSARTSLEQALARCPWVIRLQALLNENDPAADHFMLTSLLGGGLPEAQAVLDICSGALLDRPTLDAWFLREDARPTERFLWRVDGFAFMRAEEVHAKKGPPERRAMAFTMGLARCHRPELAILDLPREHMDAAKALLDGAASLILERPIPAPGVPMQIGPELSIAFQTWTKAAEFIESGAPGSEESRSAIRDADGPPMDALHAVICEPEPVGRYRRVWSWPRTAIERIEAGRAVIFRSRRSGASHSARAQRSWHDFATAWASLVRAEATELRTMASECFRVLAPVDASGAGEDAELAWFVVEGFEPGAVRARYTVVPLTRPEVQEGEGVLIPVAQVRDWRVALDGHDFGPDDPGALLVEIDRRRGLP